MYKPMDWIVIRDLLRTTKTHSSAMVVERMGVLLNSTMLLI